MTAFLDSSALVKRYAPEAGSDVVNGIVESGETLWISELSAVEVVSGLMKKVRKGDLSFGDAEEAARFFIRDMTSGRFRFSVFESGDKASAVRILRSVGRDRRLGSLDALIVSSALRVGRRIDDLEFVTSDGGQAFVAESWGLRVQRVSLRGA